MVLLNLLTYVHQNFLSKSKKNKQNFEYSETAATAETALHPGGGTEAKKTQERLPYGIPVL